ncbi:hypothetical protein BDF19DRAFT_455943 [Syncephalis fuscata]|nr:hypothetical protein BDF19DRAFT_455943 [Syncephalis fuscata]
MKLTSTLLSGRENDQYYMLDPSSPTNETFSGYPDILNGQGAFGESSNATTKPMDGKKRWTNSNKPKVREQERDRKRTSWLSIPKFRKAKTNRSDIQTADNLSTHTEESDDNHNSIYTGGRASSSDGHNANYFGVPNYLADTCIEAGPYILDLSTNWQDVSPAVSSNGFARAVRTLSRVPNSAGRSNTSSTPVAADPWAVSEHETSMASAENELQARAIFMATRVVQTFPAIYERVRDTKKTGTRLDSPIVVPAESAIAQLTEHIALGLYTVWPCMLEDPNNSMGQAVSRSIAPALLDHLRQSVEMTLSRGGLSLKVVAQLPLPLHPIPSPPGSATSDLFCCSSSTASSSSLPHTPTNHSLMLTTPTSASASASPVIRPTTMSPKPAAHEAEYAVRAALQQVFGEHISSARKSQLVERARSTLERCLASERRLSAIERNSMYRFQRLQSAIAWETVQWRYLVEESKPASSASSARSHAELSTGNYSCTSTSIYVKPLAGMGRATATTGALITIDDSLPANAFPTTLTLPLSLTTAALPPMTTTTTTAAAAASRSASSLFTTTTTLH